MTYADKLKDPRWQKKRLEILNRDDFTCQICYDGESTLHVHHKYYILNREPWEYPDNLLITLCENCHKHEEEELEDITSDLIKILKTKFFFRQS